MLLQTSSIDALYKHYDTLFKLVKGGLPSNPAALKNPACRMCFGVLQMLTQQQQRQAAASGSSFMEKPSIGSLFVPTRMQQPKSEASTTARIALPGLRQPTSASDDLGLIMGPQFNKPAMAAGEHCAVVGVSEGLL